jgi:hypothetical protein
MRTESIAFFAGLREIDDERFQRYRSPLGRIRTRKRPWQRPS